MLFYQHLKSTFSAKVEQLKGSQMTSASSGEEVRPLLGIIVRPLLGTKCASPYQYYRALDTTTPNIQSDSLPRKEHDYRQYHCSWQSNKEARLDTFPSFNLTNKLMLS